MAGDADQEKRLREMVRTAKERSENQMLGTIPKGQRGGALDMVEILSTSGFCQTRRKSYIGLRKGILGVPGCG